VNKRETAHRSFLLCFLLCPLVISAGNQESNVSEVTALGNMIQCSTQPATSNLMKEVTHAIDTIVTEDPEKVKELAAYRNSTQGFSLLHLAAVHNKTKLIQLFLQAREDANAQDNDGRTALHLLTMFRPSLHNEQRYTETWKLFLEAIPAGNVNANVQDNDGNTALHILTQIKYIKPLITAGACKYIHNKQMHIPLDHHLAQCAASCNPTTLNELFKTKSHCTHNNNFMQRENIIQPLLHAHCPCHMPDEIQEKEDASVAASSSSSSAATQPINNEDDLTSSIPHDERNGTALDERTGLPLNHPVNSDQFFN